MAKCRKQKGATVGNDLDIYRERRKSGIIYRRQSIMLRRY